MSPLVAGVDCSTQATKVLVVDSDGGEVVAEGRAPHDVSGSGGARETDPEQWWEALRARSPRPGGRARLAAIAVAGQQHGLVVTDVDGRPLRPAMLWNDTRSAAEAAELRDGARRARPGGPSEIGVVPVPSFTATRWAWLRAHEPDVAARRRGGAPAARLHHRAPLRPRRHRPRRRVGHRLVVHPRRELLRRGARPACGSTARCCPRCSGPPTPRARSARAPPGSSACAEGALVGPGTGDNMGAALGLGLRRRASRW